MKCVIIWSNGDKEVLKVSDEFLKTYDPGRPWDKWIMGMANKIGGWNMTHARKVYLEE